MDRAAEHERIWNLIKDDHTAVLVTVGQMVRSTPVQWGVFRMISTARSGF